MASRARYLMSTPIRAAGYGEAAALADGPGPSGEGPTAPSRRGGRFAATGLPQAARLLACALAIAGDRVCERLVDLLLPAQLLGLCLARVERGRRGDFRRGRRGRVLRRHRGLSLCLGLCGDRLGRGHEDASKIASA